MFKLDERLQNDTHDMGMVNGIHLRLHKNAEVPWFILVPETDVIELCDLPETEFQNLMETSNKLSLFIRQQWQCNKINVAAIGNVVSQLHLHVIGRFKDDYAWPGVVWGINSDNQYSNIDIQNIINQVKSSLIHKTL